MRQYYLAAALAAFAAHGIALADDPIELVVWDQHTGAASDVADDLYAKFEAAHPNIKIRREVYTLDQMIATAKTAMASGSGPDVLYFEVGAGREMFRAGLIKDITDYSTEFHWKDRYFPGAYNFGVDKGHLYGLGLEYEYAGIFYNDTLFKKEGWSPPSTLSEMLNYCKVAAAKGYLPVAHSQNPGFQNYFTFTMPLHNIVGVTAMEKLLFDGEGSWNTPDVIRAINVVDKDMKDAGCFANDVNGMTQDDAEDLMISGKSLMFPIGTWEVRALVEGTEGRYDIKMMPFPSIEGGKGGRVYTAGMGSLYMISAKSKHPNEAAMLLYSVLSPEAGKQWVEKARFIPPFHVDTAGLQIPPLQEDVLKTLTSAAEGGGDAKLGYNVDLFVPDPFNTMMREGFQAVMAGSKTPEQQAADLEKLWEGRDR
jgi:raffinose/stachyose/melibiose transport system substrate-binding protein